VPPQWHTYPWVRTVEDNGVTGQADR
jgi:hypothetical protein